MSETSWLLPGGDNKDNFFFVQNWGYFISLLRHGGWSMNDSCPSSNNTVSGDNEPTRMMAWLAITFGLSFSLLFLVGWLCALVSPGQVNIDAARSMFAPCWHNLVNPEPTERMVYVALVFASPLVVLLSGFLADFLLKYWRFGKDEQTLFSLFPIGMACASVVILAVLCIESPFPLALVRPASLHNGGIVAVIICLGWLVIITLRKRTERYPWEQYCGCFFMGSVIILMLLVSASFRFIPYFDAVAVTYMDHIGATFYPVSQIAQGKTILVDFVPQYGLYASFLKPVFSVIGTGVQNFSVVMVSLLSMALLFIFFAARQVIRSMFLFCVFVVSFTYLAGICWHMVLVAEDPIFQWWPIRTIFPALFLWLSLRGLKQLTPLWCAGVGGVAGLAAAWNMDTGIVLIIAWVGVLACHEWGLRSHALVSCSWFSSLRFLLFGIIGVVAGLVLSAAWLCWQAGQWLPFHKLGYHQKIFYQHGFGMLPMPLTPHPWMLVATVYLLCLIMSLRKTLAGTASFEERFMLLLTLMGVGIFSIYQGRSHDFNLPFASWPAILLVFMLFDRVVQLSVMKKKRCNLFLLVPWVWVFVMFGLSLFFSLPVFANKLVNKWNAMRLDRETRSPSSAVVKFIKKHSSSDRSVAIFSISQAIYYAETGLSAGVPRCGLHEVFSVEDFERVQKSLQSGNVQDVFTDQTFDVSQWLNERYEKIDEFPAAGLSYWRLKRH